MFDSYATNITAFNSKNKVKAEMALTEKMKELRMRASQIDVSSCDADTQRQFKFIMESRDSSNQTVTEERSKIAVAMMTVYVIF